MVAFGREKGTFEKEVERRGVAVMPCKPRAVKQPLQVRRVRIREVQGGDPLLFDDLVA